MAFYRPETPHEEELSVPLITAGPAMAPAVIEAVRHKDMKYRRYAITALGHTGGVGAIPVLEQIVRDNTEEEYFRGDALHALYLLQPTRAKQFAAQHAKAGESLGMMAEAILRDEEWLRAGTE